MPQFLSFISWFKIRKSQIINTSFFSNFTLNLLQKEIFGYLLIANLVDVVCFYQIFP